ncbi:MAG: hypothetical protein NMNS01_20770 [Nitrosomonas sp.]|nr:MAG: hypothetical protein NMNS01_20770 [Nitrosomonas sp.]
MNNIAEIIACIIGINILAKIFFGQVFMFKLSCFGNSLFFYKTAKLLQASNKVLPARWAK